LQERAKTAAGSAMPAWPRQACERGIAQASGRHTRRNPHKIIHFNQLLSDPFLSGTITHFFHPKTLADKLKFLYYIEFTN
jgi:hypothetical protein